MTIKNRISEILKDSIEKKTIDLSQALELASLDRADLWEMFSAASRIREHFRGNSVDLCSIINAKSGECSEDCSYCVQSAHHSTGVEVYPLINVEKIAEAAISAKQNGARRFCIVTSGRGIETQEDLEIVADGIGRIRALGLLPCATLGNLTTEQLSFLKDAGLHRYHHNIETSRNFFSTVCTTHSFDDRIEVVRRAKGLGLSVCSGGILGMGETMMDRIDMAFTLSELDVDSVPINFLMRMKGTPLENIEPITPLDALHSIALFRFILPQKEIRVCGGRGGTLRQLHPMIFAAGADGFMIGNYLTTSGLDPEEDRNMIRDLGLEIAVP